MAKIKWVGGERPVSGDTKVKVFYRGGDEEQGFDAYTYRWNHYGAAEDIIAYEVIEETENVTSEPKQIMASEKTLWDEYAMTWLKSREFSGMTVGGIAIECKAIADEMMKARAK
jgi:hypothetical protein